MFTPLPCQLQMDEFIDKLQYFRVARTTKQGRSHVFDIEALLASSLSDQFAETSALDSAVEVADGPALVVARDMASLKQLWRQLRNASVNSRCGRCNQINMATRECKLSVRVLSTKDRAVIESVERLLNYMVDVIKKVPEENDAFQPNCRSCQVIRGVMTVFVVPEVPVVVEGLRKSYRIQPDMNVAVTHHVKDDWCAIM